VPVYLVAHRSQYSFAPYKWAQTAKMQHQHDTRTEAALYWAAVSLIVCEGLSIEKAADRLGVDGGDLTNILHRRQSLRPGAFVDLPPSQPRLS
jgi:hypothetical protein